ncbi:hypothetical protein D3C72_2419000 [compost metagenome]
MITGRRSKTARRMGAAIAKATSSGLAAAMDLGMISPTTTMSRVSATMENAAERPPKSCAHSATRMVPKTVPVMMARVLPKRMVESR